MEAAPAVLPVSGMDLRATSIFEANGVELCAEAFGDPGDPAILLIMGSSASMDWWEDAFCERLAAGPRFVVRYDHRDTGRSVSYEPGSPPYSMSDWWRTRSACSTPSSCPARTSSGCRWAARSSSSWRSGARTGSRR